MSPPTVALLTPGQRIADAVAAVMGSWTFIIVESVILCVWTSANLVGAIRRSDPYPLTLLNLALSFQGADAAPVIMMSHNRRQDIDREAAKNEYRIDVKAELEIELLHEKIDQPREREILTLTEAARMLTGVGGAGVGCTRVRCGRRRAVITSDYRLHGVMSFFIRRAEVHNGTLLIRRTAA